MSWRDIVFDTGGSAPPPQQKPAEAVANSNSNIPGLPGFTATPSPERPAAVDPAMSTTFVEKLRSHYGASPSNSIIEQFDSAVETLEEAIRDEGARFRAALKLMKKQLGVDAAKLADAYSERIGILDGEATKFGKALEAQKANEVDSRDAQVKAISGEMERKNQEIAALMSKRDELALAIVEQKTKLATAQAGFEGAQATLRSEISDSLNKLKIYVPTTTTPSAATTK